MQRQEYGQRQSGQPVYERGGETGMETAGACEITGAHAHTTA